MQVYWEPQQAAFCGVHAVNNLLQGPFYSEWDFSKIGLALTEEERKLMAAQGTQTNDYLVFMAKDSTHVDASGNFSIEVIKKAVTNMSLTVTSLNHPAMKAAKKAPEREIAFLCNLANHWLTIRKIGGVWYNLNSITANGPHSVSDVYLGAFLQQLEAEKYSIFVVRGRLPDPLRSAEGKGMWLKAEQITNKGTKDARIKPAMDAKSRPQQQQQQQVLQQASSSSQAQVQRAIALSMQQQDAALQRALALSRQDASRATAAGAGTNGDLQRALALSRAEAAGSAPQRSPNSPNVSRQNSEDDELAAAIALSLQQ